MGGVGQAQLDEVARRMNEGPRKALGFEKPTERFLRWTSGL